MSKKIIFLISLVIIFCFLFPVSLQAHPGDTDAYGGHYNHSTGEYHYHHGYPEHQHIDGGCPYMLSIPSQEETIKSKEKPQVGAAKRVYTIEEYQELTREKREQEELETKRKTEEALRILEERKKAESLEQNASKKESSLSTKELFFKAINWIIAALFVYYPFTLPLLILFVPKLVKTLCQKFKK